MEQPTRSQKILRLLGWIVLTCLILAWRGPSWLTALQPKTYHEWRFIADFFQEWASAHNYWTGLPIYTPQEVTLPLYLGEHKNPNDPIFTEVNAHPPASVLLALPLALLDYDEAFVLWNEASLILFAASIWLVLWTLEIKMTPGVLFALVTLCLLCHPLLSHVQQGQLTIPLVFLLTLSWSLERSGRPWVAGAFLGLATALKLFPGFLFLPLILRRRWQAVIAGVGCLIAVVVLTVAVFGIDTYRSYVWDVLPFIQRYRGACHNLSLCGVWYKLLVPLSHWMPVTFEAATPHPLAAACGYLICAGLIVLVLSRAILRNPDDTDLSFSISMLALLLIGPVTWDHYLLLLLVPTVVLWQRLPRSSPAWLAFLGCAVLLFIEPLLVMEHCLILVGAETDPQTGRWLAMPLETLTALSVPCYALVGLFVLLLFSARQRTLVRVENTTLTVKVSEKIE